MERYSRIAVIFIPLLFSGAFFPDDSQSKAIPSSEPIFPKSEVDVASDANRENPPSRPLMNLQDIEDGKNQPPEKKPLDLSAPRNMKATKAPEKKTNWFVRTFWLVVNSWIDEKNRNDPVNDRRFEQNP